MKKRLLKRVQEETRQRAIRLRRDATHPEQLLWSILCRRKLGGLKFRRQHPIEPYIVDFYCATENLIIELDGESHEGCQEYDRQRTEYLQRLGLSVVRFTNDDVITNLEGVAEAILRITQCENQSPLP